MPELPDITIYIEALQARILGERLERIRVPTLILAGQRDVLVSPRSFQDLSSGIDKSQLVRLPGLLLRTIRSVLRLVRRRREMPVIPPRPILDTPRVSFNGAITARRSFATGSSLTRRSFVRLLAKASSS